MLEDTDRSFGACPSDLLAGFVNRFEFHHEYGKFEVDGIAEYAAYYYKYDHIYHHTYRFFRERAWGSRSGCEAWS